MDVMIDIETLSLRADAAVLEIGARQFSVGGILGEGFHVFVDVNSQAGRHINAETLMWWMQQPDASRLWQTAGHLQSVSMAEALNQLAAWLSQHLGEKDRLWSKGELDIAVLKHAYHCDERFGMEPWGYRQIRDMRTWMDAQGHYPLDADLGESALRHARNLMPADMMAEHRADADCIRQICEMWMVMEANAL